MDRRIFSGSLSETSYSTFSFRLLETRRDVPALPPLQNDSNPYQQCPPTIYFYQFSYEYLVKRLREECSQIYRLR